jgi:hypothetical protein
VPSAARAAKAIERQVVISRITGVRPVKLLKMIVWEEELDQTVRPIARSLQGRAGRQRTVLEPLENVSTLAKAAPKPRGHGVSASIGRSGPRLGRRVRIYKCS